jgi:hypothetical protein
MWFCFVFLFCFFVSFIYFDSGTLYIFVFFFFFVVVLLCCVFSVCRAYIIFAVVYSLMGRRGGWAFFLYYYCISFFLSFFIWIARRLNSRLECGTRFVSSFRHSLKKKILVFQIYQLGIGQRRSRRTFFSGLTSHSMIRWVSGHWPAQYTRERERSPAQNKIPIPSSRHV